ncbi:MAG: RDD family protein [Planctomycetaceae bacterium]|nr:RDD family protein [Planctomycetaceae bacterium]
MTDEARQQVTLGVARMSAIQFETPENVQLSYKPAGLGTRFLAWFVDGLIIFICLMLLLFVVVIAGAASDSLLKSITDPLRDASEGFDPNDPESAQRIMLYLFGLWMLVWGLGSFFYFGISELCLRGQTLGKRASKIRVVKVDGFALDAISILVRNVFRVVDHLPVLWIVPLLSARSQRFGDMIAGTIVIEDEPAKLAGPRHTLANRSAADARFRFDAGQLKKLRPEDVQAVEQLLERWTEISADRREQFVITIVYSLCQRLDCEPPPSDASAHSVTDSRRVFLEDLLAAEYRRQNRQLG